MTTSTIPDVPVPSGASADEWQSDSPLPYRVLLGEVRGIDDMDIDRMSVQPTAVQFSDGRIDDGSVEPPHVYLGGDSSGLTSAQARQLAALLIAAADEVDGWSATLMPSTPTTT